jgi:hypothetical protein
VNETSLHLVALAVVEVVCSQVVIRLVASEHVAEGAEHNVYGERPEWLTQTILDWLGKH